MFQKLLNRLTRRQREVLKLVARGMTNKEIAEILVISEKTVKNHVSEILSKLGLSSRTQAATFAQTQAVYVKHKVRHVIMKKRAK